MAHQAPEAKYTRKLFVADHAVERLRERLKQANNAKFVSLDAVSLGNRLDEVVAARLDEHEYESLTDEGVPARLVNISEPFEDALYALIKPNHGPLPRNGPKDAIVTILTLAMVTNRRASKKWEAGDDEDWAAFTNTKGGLPKGKTMKIGTQMGEKLKGITIALTPTAKRTSKLPSESERTPPPQDATATETRIITYRITGGSMIQVEEYGRKDVIARYAELAEDPRVIRGTIRIWREVKTRVRVEFDE